MLYSFSQFLYLVFFNCAFIQRYFLIAIKIYTLIHSFLSFLFKGFTGILKDLEILSFKYLNFA